MTVGEQIRTQRKQAGFSQEQVAERLGVTRQAVTKWEAGQSVPSSENLIALAALFQISLDTLVANDVPRCAPEKKPSNPILRSNLTMLAIACQAGALHACTQISYTLDPATGTKVPDHGLFLFKAAVLLLCSIWMASNLRFEPDPVRRRKNSRIELLYCLAQLTAALLTYRFGLGLVGLLAAIALLLIYILFVNPRYMGRKFTK